MTTNLPPSQTELLFVDDDQELRAGLMNYFGQLGYHVASAGDGYEALELCKKKLYHVVVIDMAMPGMSGLELLEKLREELPDTEQIMLTGEGTIETAVDAMKLGASDFLTKPVRMKQLLASIQKVVATRQLRVENQQLKAILSRSRTDHRMIGESAAMQQVYRLIERAGPSNKPILIEGESGTGKELVARALHEASSRSDKPLVVINCAALPEQLLESELFGHEKGAFTGASTSKPGLFEVADGGTLFIDEIGELSPALQPKLLRVLEDGSLRRVGSLRERRVNVRLLAATNRELLKEVEAKRFREDLYYRINIMTISLPPLRDRGDDVLMLAEAFKGSDFTFADEVKQLLRGFSWPGNVRQLLNAIERAKILTDTSELRRVDFPPEITGEGTESRMPLVTNPDADLATLTRAHVVGTLRREGGNKLRSAKLLGVSRRSLYRLIEKYGINADEIGSHAAR